MADEGGSSRGESSERGPFAMFGALTGIAVTSAVLVVGGAVLGYLLDGWTGAPHVFIFVGIVLGAVVAVMSARSIVQRFFG
jgi:F0F1-type ATP synthase assembly protein I